ncbi:polysaccharide biosynthesis protein [Actinoplanes sp. NBRC 14428]|uniref:O-antigen/teichoic acid export membrane protein n=1 Tax=Pseudosporangium ferrugineum TaxID=439699 RepID=A0A2T0SFJ2_9ACTN|nr:polysaccharide biosynthesis protein [Pseudosporangium ferrugineum]PRY32185.1 O-antigen/teichoic acid export membrane protein [Pseudosporangium ferrugineum]BCJ49570.1 polysaccharide biosynthesis protein [Actinoplanes sp. NBRC 14428]
MTDLARRFARLAARGAAPIAVAVAVQSAGNLAFHSVVGRMLDPGSYGALGAVLSAMVMLGVPLGALQTAASALVAEHGLTRDTARRTLRSVALWSTPPALLVLLGAPLLRDYFHLASLAEAAQLAPYLLVAAVVAAARGLLLGDRQVGTVAMTYLVGTVARLALGLALVVPFGVSGALAGTVAAEVAALLVAAGRLRGPAGRYGTTGLRLGAVAHAGFAVTGLFLFSTADLLLARHHLGDAASGSYVAAATVAKTVLALPAGIMAAVFPRLLAAWPTAGRGRALLGGGAAVTGPALLGGLVVVAVPGLVLTVLYGDGYADAAGLVRALAGVAALTSFVTVLTHAALARRSRLIAVPWCGAVLEVALIETWHGSATQIAACSAAALAPTLLVMALLEGRRWARAPRPNAQVTGGGADPSRTAATAA